MSSRASRIATIILAILATLAVAAAAWQWNRWSRSNGPAAAAGPKVDPLRAGRMPRPPVAASQPGGDSLLGLLLSGAKENIELRNADPADLPPPPGARRVSSVRQPLPDMVREAARYLVNSPPEVLESFYAKSLADRGWEPAARRLPSGGIAWRKAGQICWLRVLRPGTTLPDGTTRPDAGATEFSVVVTTPATP
ncbi:MAG: hypothetical protein PHU85_13915 [Phycisphaerae bacterium]|nr:hypothetical protein [Phycisphaerae bacterium]